MEILQSDWIQIFYKLHIQSVSKILKLWTPISNPNPKPPTQLEVSMDMIRIGYPAGYLRCFRIRIGFGYSFLKKIGSGQDQELV